MAKFGLYLFSDVGANTRQWR